MDKQDKISEKCCYNCVHSKKIGFYWFFNCHSNPKKNWLQFNSHHNIYDERYGCVGFEMRAGTNYNMLIEDM